MKRVVAVAGTAVCALLAAVGVHLWATSSDTGTSVEHAAVPRLPHPPRNGGLADGDVAASSGSLTIRGRIVGPVGPVAGVVVAAFTPYDDAADPLVRALCAGVEQGVDDGDEAPFGCEAGDAASVAVAEAFASRATERRVMARATTDAEGRFALEGLSAGSYDVWAEREGGFAHMPDQEAPADDLVLKLEPGVLLHGKVQVNGEPPKGALLVSGAVAGFPRVFEAQTAAEGAFSLGPVPATDRAIVSTLLEGYLGAHEVVEDLGSERGSESEVVLSLDSPRHISGVVLDDRGPAAGVKVSIEGEASKGIPDATTDTAGRFTFQHVHPGELTVSATRPFAVGHEAVIVPSDRDPPLVTVDLEPVGVVRGVVRDEGGQPVADATVFLTGHEVEHTGPDGRYELTEAGPLERLLVRADGFVSVDEELHVPPGSAMERDVSLKRALLVRGTVVDEGGQPIHLATLVIRDDTTADGNQAATDKDGAFELETAAERTEVEVEAQGYVTVRRAMAAGTQERVVLRKGGSLLVRLVDTEGHPVAEGTLTAVPLRGSAERRTVGSQRTQGMPANEHLLDGLTAGDYRLEVRTESQLEVRLVRSDGHARQELEVRIPAPGQISGMVVSSTGAPLAGTYVRATEVLEGERGRNAASSRTDERGEFHLPARRGGRYTLLAIKDNRPPATGVAATVDGARVTIVLPEAAKVHGRILYPDGTPATGFIFNGEHIKGAAGRFEHEVGSGDLQLAYSAPGFAARVVSVTVQPGEDRDLGDLTLAEGRTVAVRVVDARTNQPVGGALVHVSGIDTSGDPELATSVDEPPRRTRTDGTAALSHVPDSAVVCVDADGYQSATAPLGPGSSETVRLEPNGALRVFLDDPFEGPLWVSVEGAEDHTLPLDPRAGATFSRLPSGEYTVALWRAPPVPGQKWKGTLAPVQPREISLPMEGPNELHFRLRSSGTDVTVAVNGVAPDADLQTLLVPERADIGQMLDNPLSMKLDQVLVPDRPGQRGPARFSHVPDGTYRVAAMVFGTGYGGTYLDPRPLVLASGRGGPASREVVITVPDDWRAERD